MNEIVIGVKPVSRDSISESDEDMVGSMGAVWVTYNGEELPCVHEGNTTLISVKLECDAGPSIVTLKLIGGYVRTVRFDGEEAPERFRAKE